MNRVRTRPWSTGFCPLAVALLLSFHCLQTYGFTVIRPQMSASGGMPDPTGNGEGLQGERDNFGVRSSSPLKTTSRKPGSTYKLQELKAGQELKGGVVRVSEFAAFLDVRVVRKGKGGKQMRVNALLHPHDLLEGYALIPDDQEVPVGLAESGKHISKGSHVQVYVKDVFPNSGRFSVTMDPSVTRDQVVAARLSRRSAVKRRTRIKRMEETDIGTEKRATVIKVLPSGFLVDAGLPVPAFLPNTGLPEGVSPEDVAQKGALLQVSIEEKSEKQLVCRLISLTHDAIPPKQ